MTTRISRNSPCVCGSGKRFKQCCGQDSPPHWGTSAVGRLTGSLLDGSNAHLVANEPQCDSDIENLPPGILVQSLGDEYDWQMYREAMQTTPVAGEATIVRNGKVVRDPQRVTQIVDQGQYADGVTELVRKAYTGPVEAFFDCKLRWFEQPHILRYQPGGFYRTHADSDSWSREDQSWTKVLDRDLSLLIYLDEGYQGGELIFPNFNFRLRPRAGMLVAFPADHRYLHGAMPVISGVRHAVVSWSSSAGVEQLQPSPPSVAVMLNR